MNKTIPYICTGYDEVPGYQTIAFADTALAAKIKAVLPEYGSPHRIYEATQADIDWHRELGGVIIDEPPEA